jgi:hypothetical protein
MRRTLLVASFLFLASCSSAPLPTPSAQTILTRPLQASWHDAAFNLSESVPVEGGTNTAHGAGSLLRHPLAIAYSEVNDSQQNPVKLEFTSVSGTDWWRITALPGPGNWHSTPSAPDVADPISLWPALTSPRLVDSLPLKNTPSWHVSAEAGTSSFDLWVRQSDGYPLQIITLEAGGKSFTYDFFAYNTGATISAPA